LIVKLIIITIELLIHRLTFILQKATRMEAEAMTNSRKRISFQWIRRKLTNMTLFN